VVTVAEDNLVKGGAGPAVQAVNIALGWARPPGCRVVAVAMTQTGTSETEASERKPPRRAPR